MIFAKKAKNHAKSHHNFSVSFTIYYPQLFGLIYYYSLTLPKPSNTWSKLKFTMRVPVK